MPVTARPRTSFVGRTRELADIAAHLDAGARIVTLIGPGGAGKTRLSLEVSAGRPGVHVVELAGVTDGDDVPSRVAVACGLGIEPEDPAGLTEVLTGRSGDIIILDNCEHLLRACAAVARAITAAPDGPTVLATSREALRVDGEVTVAIDPLPHPDVREAPGLETLGGYDAVRLFVDRAQSAQTGFALTGGNAAAVAEICHRLDGIPLAIELAAARVAVLAPEQIAERLDDRFRVLSSPREDIDARHRTMRATIAWGFDRLAPDELALMTRAALFQGRFDAETLETACTDDLVPAERVLDLVATLAGRSLIVVEPDARTSYRLLDTVRAFALEQVQDADAWRARHLAWAVSLAAEAYDGLAGPAQAVWIGRLATLHDTLMAILTDAEQRDPEAGLQVMRGLWEHWDSGGRTRETARRLEGLIAASPSAPTALRAGSLAGLAMMLVHLGQGPESIRRAEEALAEAERSGNLRSIGVAMNAIGNARLRTGDMETARDAFHRAVQIRRELGVVRDLAPMLGNLAVLEHEMGNLEDAGVLYDEAVALFEDLGDRRRRGMALMNRATLIHERGDLASALRQYEECLAIMLELGARRNENMLRLNIGNVHLELGHVGSARDSYVGVIEAGVEIASPGMVLVAVEAIGTIAATSGDYATWARFDSAVTTLDPTWLELRDERMRAQAASAFANATAALGEEALDGARTQGARLSLTELTEEALRVAAMIDAPPAEPARAEPGRGTFRRIGDMWEVAFGFPPVRLKHMKGMSYIGHLLANPETEVHVADLIGSVGIADEEGVRQRLGDAGDAIDPDAARAYATAIRDLETEREEAMSWSDDARAERLADEIEQISSHLKASYGLAGRVRAQADPTERMRKAVTNRIRDALARIEAEDLELGRYLRNTVRTGVFCSYRPARPVTWDL